MKKRVFLTGIDGTILCLLDEKPTFSKEVEQILKNKLSKRGLELAREKGYFLAFKR